MTKPTDWALSRLNELGFVGRGRSTHRPRNASELYGGSFPFFQTGDVKAADFWLCEHSQTYNERGLAQSKLWKPGTLCITIAANIADTAVLAIPGCFPDSIVGFVPDPVKADVRFVKYSLDAIRLQLQNVSRGTTQDNLSLDKLLHFFLRIPPLPLQQRIADILSSYDNLIENCKRRIRVLDEIIRALYREWFVLFRYPGHQRVPLVKSRIGLIPRGWEPSCAEAVAQESRRSVPKGPLDIPTPYVGLEHIPRRSLALDAWEDATSVGSNKLKFEAGHVLFGKIRPYFHKVAVAPFNGVCSADALVISPRRELLHGFMVGLVSSDGFVAHASVTANGAKMPRANWSVMMKYPVAQAPDTLLARFNSLMEPVLAQQQNLILQIATLRRTRDLLLPRLLSGQTDLDIAV